MDAAVKRAWRARGMFISKMKASERADALFEAQNRQRTLTKHRSLLRHNNSRNFKRALEDLKLGPLAPKRNIGAKAIAYGTMQRTSIIPRASRASGNVTDNIFYEKHVSRNLFRPQDRVVVLRGPERGKIGRVQSVDEASMTLKLSDLNKVYLVITAADSAYMRQADSPPQGQLYAMYLRQADVRLVMTTPEGQNVVVDNMLVIKEKHKSGNDIVRRFVPGTMHDIDAGLDITPKDDEDTDEANVRDPNKHGIMDTFSHHVDATSWIATLDRPPFPNSVIDEVRNKYSKFRTNHDDEHLEKLEAIQERKKLKARAGVAMIRTPMKEYGIHQRSAARIVAEQKRLSTDSTLLIGEYMAKNLAISAQNSLTSKGNPTSRAAP